MSKPKPAAKRRCDVHVAFHIAPSGGAPGERVTFSAHHAGISREHADAIAAEGHALLERLAVHAGRHIG